jgi:hypothetical protein
MMLASSLGATWRSSPHALPNSVHFAGKNRVRAGAFPWRYVLFFCTPSFDAPARGRLRDSGASQRQSEDR